MDGWRNHELPSLETGANSLKSMSPASGCKYEAVGFQTVPAALGAHCFICEEPFKCDATRNRVRRRGCASLYVAPQPRNALQLQLRHPLFHPAAAR